MGSLVTTESQDTHLTSHPKDDILLMAMSLITALGNWDIFSKGKGASYWPSNTTSNSIWQASSVLQGGVLQGGVLWICAIQGVNGQDNIFKCL